jgi:hypothetical protein
MSRRKFLELSAACSLPLSLETLAASNQSTILSDATVQRENSPVKATTVREFLVSIIPTRRQIDIFLDPKQPNWAKFDPELGYVQRNFIKADGIDGCQTITSFEETGERTMINYARQPCRINTYGDSFTNCNQVSDGETWQEVLAAHFGEPMRNFGVGGYGTYQAYRRMLREEVTPRAAQYMILNMWGSDDYRRGIDQWRWPRFAWRWQKNPALVYQFHGNPWAYIRLDLRTGELVEKENPFPTSVSLYKLTDPQFVYEHFKDDLVIQLVAAQMGATDIDREGLDSVARALDVKADFSSREAIVETAQAVHIEYALRAGIKVIEKALEFVRARGKRLVIVLSFSDGDVIKACEGGRRFDQKVLEFLTEKNIPFVDTLEKHIEDFKNFNLSPRQYVKRYYNGHYNPLGCHFFAFAIKDAIVKWLDPRPLAYRDGAVESSSGLPRIK